MKGIADAAVTGVTGYQPEPQPPCIAEWQTKAWEAYDSHWLEEFADFPLLISRHLAQALLQGGYTQPIGPGEQLQLDYDLHANMYRYRWSPR